MKRKFLLSLAIAFGLAGSVYADGFSGSGSGTSDDPYQISSAVQLKEFADIVNVGGDNMSANAVLTNDIDMTGITSWEPIGNWVSSCAYKGHFNGQGHTIYNVNFTSFSRKYHGLFGIISTGCLIENFSISGDMQFSVQNAGTIAAYARDATPTIRNVHSSVNITDSQNNQNRHHAGIVGTVQKGTSNGGTTVIECCSYSGTLSVASTNNDANYGGIVGLVQNDSKAVCNITNCLFDGTLENTAGSPGSCSFGGIVGYCSSGNTNITNCLSKGTVNAKGGRFGQFFGIANSTSSSNKIYNSYYIGANANGGDSNVPIPNEVISVTTEKLTCGEVAFWLNESTSGGTKWFQTIGTDYYPYPYSSGHGVVYRNGTFCPDTDAPQGVYTYGNTDDAITGEHDYNESNGLCSYCGYPKSDYMTPESSYYVIDDATKLKWYAAYVNYINPAVKAKLIADINLSGIEWTPIGNSTNKYTGTFDGKGYTISNLTTEPCVYNGLFGYIDGATIKDFSINGTIQTLKSGERNYIGVIGLSENKSKISDIHSSLDITVYCESDAGGVIGSGGGDASNDKPTIDRCSYSGTLTVEDGVTADQFGGIVGYTAAATITNCLFNGTVSGNASGKGFGGIVGYTRQYIGGIQNCLSVGTISGTGGKYGAILGRYKDTIERKEYVYNNYYLSGSIEGCGQNPTMVETTAKTAEELSSGEVAYKLGTAFYQTIGSDNYPVLDSTHGVVGKIADCGYGTLYAADTDVTIPSGVTAYAGKNNGTSLKLTAIADKIKAGEAVVLVGDEGFYSFMPTTGASDVEENDLEGSDGTVTTDDSYIVYALANKTNGVGFYKVNAGVKVPAGRAYFKVSTGASAKAFYLFGEDDATSLSEELRVKSEESDAAIYNLSGQRISKLQKGFNIVNGKKVLF